MSNKNSGKQPPKRRDTHSQASKKSDPRVTTKLQGLRESDIPNR